MTLAAVSVKQLISFVTNSLFKARAHSHFSVESACRIVLKSRFVLHALTPFTVFCSMLGKFQLDFSSSFL